MNREEILNKLIECFKMSFRYDGDDLTAETPVTDTFGTNSMKRIALCAMIEDEWEVTIPASKFADYETIGDFADKILEEIEE